MTPDMDERVKVDLEPEEALRLLLGAKKRSEPAKKKDSERDKTAKRKPRDRK